MTCWSYQNDRPPKSINNKEGLKLNLHEVVDLFIGFNNLRYLNLKPKVNVNWKQCQCVTGLQTQAVN